MKKKAIVLGVFIFLLCVVCCVLFVNHTTPIISCVPNDNKTVLEVKTNNATLDYITLKYDNGILQCEDRSNYTLQIKAEGIEYISVYYTDYKGEQHSTDFEIVISQYNSIAISKLNGLGQQVDFKTY